MDNNYSGSDVRKEIISSGIRLWKVADKLGISEFTFSRKLRHNFSESEYSKVLQAIEELSKAQ